MGRKPRIGVLALQGAFREHARVLREAGADVVEVRLPGQLDGLDGLVVPGGESTTILRLASLYGLDEAIRSFPAPVFGTCAGMILLDRAHLGLADLEVDRNAYGRQVASFEADLELDGEDRPFRGVFIRAPRVRDVGADVEVLAQLDGEPVLLRDGRVLVAAFHPELTDDPRIHERFLELVVSPGTPAPPRAAANTSHAVVLGRPDISGYRGSLRPRPARFSPANEHRSSRRDH